MVKVFIYRSASSCLLAIDVLSCVVLFHLLNHYLLGDEEK